MSNNKRGEKSNSSKARNGKDYDLLNEGSHYFDQSQTISAIDDPQKYCSYILKAAECFDKIQIDKLDSEFRVICRYEYAIVCNDLLIYYHQGAGEADVIDDRKAERYGLKGLRLLEFLMKNWVNRSEPINSIKGHKTELFDYALEHCPKQLRQLCYNLGNFYSDLGNTNKSMLYYEKGTQLHHIPSIYNLASKFASENYQYYSPEIAEEYYIYAADIEPEAGDDMNSALSRVFSSYAAEEAGKIMLKRKRYDKALYYYERVLKDAWITEQRHKFIKNQIDYINELLNNRTEFTAKHEYVLSLFSDKAKRHLQDDDYLQIETSLMVYDFLSSTGNSQLDYSSAIIPILKCVENLLYPIFGEDYFGYLKSLPEVDVAYLPRDFIDRGGICLKERVSSMSYGSIIYCCTTNAKHSGFVGRQFVVPYFLDFLNQRGIDDAITKSENFVTSLIDLKDRYRNPAAHGMRISRENAKDCLDYLLDTIKFINQFLEDFYTD